MKRILTAILFFSAMYPCYSQNFWQSTSALAGGDSVHALTTTHSGAIIAESYYSGIYRSTNNGTNWVQSNSTRGVYCLSVAPDGNVYALYSTVSSINISRSTDDGVSWNNVYTHAISNNYSYDGGIAFLSGGVFVATLAETIGPTLGDIATVVVRSTN